jgi:hypothetical protein
MFPPVVRRWRARNWQRRARPWVHLLFWAQVDLIADIGEPAPAVLAACDEVDHRIVELERWMHRNPSPDAAMEQGVHALIGACSGLWAATSKVARLTPAGIDAGTAHLPESVVHQLSERVDSLEAAWVEMRRLQLL